MNLNTIRQQVLGRAAQSASFRGRLLEDAASAIEEETGWSVPEGLSVTVHEDPAAGLRLTVSGATALSDAQLSGIVGGVSDNWQDYGFETEAEANAAWQNFLPGSDPPWGSG